MISKPLRMMAAQVLENYANENISEDLEAFGQFMYHAELLRNDHLDIYLLDLHRVDQPYRDILVDVFSELDDMHNEDSVDDEDSSEDTPLSI
jgi:hypothetical protein